MHTRPVLKKAIVEIIGNNKDTILLLYKCEADGVEILGVDEGLSWVPGKGIRALRSPIRDEDGGILFEARLSIAKKCEFRARSWKGETNLWEEGKNHVLERLESGQVLLDGEIIEVERQEEQEPEPEGPKENILEQLVMSSSAEFTAPEPETPIDLFEWVLKATHFLLNIESADDKKLELLSEHTRMYRDYYGLTPSKVSFELFQGFSVILQEAIYARRKCLNREDDSVNCVELWSLVKQKIKEWFDKWQNLDIEHLFPETEEEFEKEKEKLVAYFNQLL